MNDNTPVPRKILCAYCQGGNPLDYMRCQWCGAPPRAQSPNHPSSPLPPLPPRPQPPQPDTQPSLLATANPFDIVKWTGNWLNKIGIVLFLFGVVLLFKYSIDKGWLTEAMRVNIGLALGTTLLAWGLIIKGDHPNLSRVLLGGSIATYYITAFAAFRIFHIDYVTFEVAFGFMAAVTILAFALSVTQDGVMLALIGIAGGLSTPFMLYTDGIRVPDLVAYTCFIIAGATAIYMYKGWRSLLWLSFSGAWLVFILVFINNAWRYASGGISDLDRLILQLGVAFAALVFWILPSLREVLQAYDPRRWPSPTLPSAFAPATPNTSTSLFIDSHAHVLSLLTPLLALGFSAALWGEQVQHETWGWIAIGSAALYGLAFYLIAPYNRLLAGTQGISGLALLTIGISLVLQGDALFMALAAEAAALLLVGRRLQSMWVAGLGHTLFGGVALWMFGRIGNDLAYAYAPATAILNPRAITELAVIALALGISLSARHREEAWVYAIGAHGAMLAVLWRELSTLHQGYQYVLLAWAAYALVLHLWASQSKDVLSRWVAHTILGTTGFLLLSKIATGLILTIPDDTAIFTVRGLTNLGVILASAIAYMTLRDRKESLAYGFGLHLAYLGWTWQELGLLQNGNGYVSVAWGVYAIVLVAAAWRTNRNRPILYAGISTLFIVAGKLFLVDLRYLDPIWRSLLFIGFGGLFLLLSHTFHRITRRPEPASLEAANSASPGSM